jgi:hypothetical protein
MRTLVLLGLLVGCGATHRGPNDLGAPSDLGGSDLEPAAPDLNPTVNTGIISTSAGSQFQAETSLAVAGDVVGVSWIDVASTTTIGYALSTDGGRHFGQPVKLASPGGRLASDPSMVADAHGNIWVVWIGYLGGALDGHVYYAKAAAGSSTFGAISEVTDPTENFFYDRPSFAVTNQNTLLVTYARGAPGGMGTDTLVVARSTDGVAWTRTLVSTGGGFRDFIYPCPPRAGSRVWFVASDSAVGTAVRWSDDDGASWPSNSASAALGSDAVLGDPKCVSNNQDVWVMDGVTNDTMVAMDALPKLNGIRVAHSSDGGQTFASTFDAADSAAAPFFQRPVLAIEETGALDLVYYAGTMDNDLMGSYRRSRSTDQGATWSPSVAVHAPVDFLQSRSSSRWIGDYTGLSAAQGTFYTSYVDNSGTVSHIAFYRTAVP